MTKDTTEETPDHVEEKWKFPGAQVEPPTNLVVSAYGFS
jgi:hypothetical protein